MPSTYEITMADFLDRLECIRQKLTQRGSALISLGSESCNNEWKSIEEKDFALLFRFFSLDFGGAVDGWKLDPPEKVDRVIFQKLNAFLQGISFGFYDDMHKRWKATIEDVQRHDTNPEAEVVKKCIVAVQKDQDENVLKKHYGIKQFQDHDYGKSTPDKSIVSILGLILFWFANLPCTEDAKQEQTRYRKRLQLKMDLLLNPESVEEFPLVSQEAYDNMILNDAQRTCCPKSFQSDEKNDYRPLYENELGKDKTQTQ